MKRYLHLALVFLALLAVVAFTMVVFSGMAFAATFAWDANTEPDLAGYRLYRAPGSGAAATPTCGTFVPVNEFGLVTTGQDYPPDGRWCYHLTAFDDAWIGNESGPSNRVYLQVPQDTTPPGVPGSLQVVTP